MEAKLRAYMDQLFSQTAPTRSAVELKEEMLQNLIEKYNDLLAEGKTPEAAYNIATASIGDISELLEQLKKEETQMPRYTEEQIETSRLRSAICVSIAVMLYILSVIPCIIWDDYGVVLMFIMIAAATGLIIYNSMTKLHYQKSDGTVVEEFKEWQGENEERKKLQKANCSAIFSITVVLYIIISFTTGAWHITWVIFLISTAIQNIIKACFDLKRSS